MDKRTRKGRRPVGRLDPDLAAYYRRIRREENYPTPLRGKHAEAEDADDERRRRFMALKPIFK